MATVRRLTFPCLLVAMLFSSTAWADSIPLTGGFLEFDVDRLAGGGAPSKLSGERGFTYTGAPLLNPAASDPPFLGNPLPPGTTLEFDAGALGPDVGGTVTLDGITYENVGGLSSPTGAWVRLTATVPLPGVLSAHAMVTAPFFLDFEFRVFDPETASMHHTLFGSGFATFTLVEDASFGVPSWRLEHVRADLSSTPIAEPSTLLLLASSVGLALTRARRRRLA